MSDYKKRVEQAMLNHHKKDLKEIDKLQGNTRKNKKPEKDVQKACVTWMRSEGWIVSILEAKATMDQKGNWRNQAMQAGTVDCIGVMPGGISVIVEFKAPGKLNNVSEGQHKFIISRIKLGAFAVVVDSVRRLESLCSTWQELKQESDYKAKDFLYQSLPTPKRDQEEWDLE